MSGVLALALMLVIVSATELPVAQVRISQRRIEGN